MSVTTRLIRASNSEPETLLDAQYKLGACADTSIGLMRRC